MSYRTIEEAYNSEGIKFPEYATVPTRGGGVQYFQTNCCSRCTEAHRQAALDEAVRRVRAGLDEADELEIIVNPVHQQFTHRCESCSRIFANIRAEFKRIMEAE